MAQEYDPQRSGPLSPSPRPRQLHNNDASPQDASRGDNTASDTMFDASLSDDMHSDEALADQQTQSLTHETTEGTSKKRRFPRLTTIFAMACLLGAAGAGFYAQRLDSDLSHRIQANDATIAGLNGDIQNANQQRSSIVDLNGAAVVQDAHNAAQHMADLQNAFVASDANYQQISDEAASLVDTNSRRNVRLAWFGPYLDIKTTWSVVSTYDLSGSKVNVLWVSTPENSSEIMALATATWDGDQHLFTDVHFWETLRGASHHQANSDDASAANTQQNTKEYWQDQINKIKEANPDIDKAPDDPVDQQTWDDIRKSQEQSNVDENGLPR